MLGKDVVVLGLAGVIGVLACSERGETARKICPAPGPKDPRPYAGELTGITGAASDAWAIGPHTTSEGVFERPALVHWDGCDWHEEASPFDAAPRHALLTVAASGHDVWLSGCEQVVGKIGIQCPETGGRVFRRRDGRWQQIDRSNTGARKVFALWANGPDDAWMLENPCGATGTDLAQLRHWDGRVVVDVGEPPGVRAPGVLWSSGPRDVWVGGAGGGGEGGGVAHWDGAAWRSFSIDKQRIHALAGGGASDVWASGREVHHWDGSRWSEPSVPTVIPKPGGTGILWLGAARGGHTFGADAAGNIYRSDRAALTVIGRLRPGASGVPFWWQNIAGGRDDFMLFLRRKASRPEMRWSNRTWTVLAPELAGEKGEDVVALWADRAATVWAAVSFRLAPGNVAGEIRRWNGKAWERAATLEQFPYHFWGLAPDDLWLVGFGGASWHWDGKQWRTVPTGTAERLFSIWGSGPKDVWAGGESGTVLRWDGGAWRRWSTLNAVDNYTSITAMGGVSADFVVAAGSSHAIRWDGQGWVPSDGRRDLLGQNTSVQISGVWASGPRDVWLVGTGGDVQESPDRRSSTTLPTPLIVHGDGRDWNRVVVGLGSRLRAITGAAANDVWTVGEEGTVLHWNGEDWSSVASGTEANLLAVAKAADGSVWIGGEGGFLRRLP